MLRYMELEWQNLKREQWDKLASNAGAAVQQDWAYGEAMAGLGAKVLRVQVSDAGGPLALAQFTTRRFFGILTWALCTRGPVWIGQPDAKTKADVYRSLRDGFPGRRPRAIFFTPNETEAAEELQQAKLRRVMTGYSTVLLDLSHDTDHLRAAMHGKWRNRLVAAEKSDLTIVRNGLKPAQYAWILETEEAQQKQNRYSALPTRLVAGYQSAKEAGDGVRIWRADLGREKVAAMLFLIHGRAATYHMGWSNEAGRRNAAHNLILWQAIEALKAEGITSLDLGGVNTEQSPGVARFKLGTGGAPVTLCGTYF